MLVNFSVLCIRETNCVTLKIVDRVVAAQEDITCRMFSNTYNLKFAPKHLPIIQRLPQGRLISIPWKEEMHVP